MRLPIREWPQFHSIHFPRRPTITIIPSLYSLGLGVFRLLPLAFGLSLFTLAAYIFTFSSPVSLPSKLFQIGSQDLLEPNDTEAGADEKTSTSYKHYAYIASAAGSN